MLPTGRSSRAPAVPLERSVNWLPSSPVPSASSTDKWYHSPMKRKRQRVVDLIFSRPTSANIQWRDIEALFIELGAEVEERVGSRVSVFLFEEVRVFHRPHPSPNTDKGAVASIRKWLEQHGVEP